MLTGTNFSKIGIWCLSSIQCNAFLAIRSWYVHTLAGRVQCLFTMVCVCVTQTGKMVGVLACVCACVGAFGADDFCVCAFSVCAFSTGAFGTDACGAHCVCAHGACGAHGACAHGACSVCGAHGACAN